MPASQLSGSSPGEVVTSQKRSTSAGWSSTRNAQPWLNPALGARTALASARSTTAGSTGVSAYSRIMRRRRTTSWNSMEPSVPDHFERMWADLAPVGRSATSGGYFRQPFTTPERELVAWFTEQATARSLRLESDAFGNLVAWWDAGVVRDETVEIPGSEQHLRHGLPRRGVVTGSHLDSVLDGGAYDGPLGVVSALAAVDLLRERGFRPTRPIGVSVFVEEEGSRFGLACLGSRLATGATDWSQARALRDRNGVRAGGGDGLRRARGRESPALVGLLAHRVLRGAPRRAGTRPGRPRRRGRRREPDLAARSLPRSTSPVSRTTRVRRGWRTAGTRC